MSTPKRIGIIEDENILLDLLEKYCRDDLGHDVVFTATTATAGLTRLLETKPDGLLLDINLPDGDGIKLVQQIRIQSRDLKIILLSADTTPETIKRVRESGVNGYVSKYTYSTCLLTAFTEVFDHHRRYFSPVEKRPDDATAPYMKLLTSRERELLPFLAIGYADTEVAAQVGVTASTVRKHRECLMHKLNFQRRLDLLSFCFEKGILKSRPDGQLIMPKWSDNTK
jgi:DNA-binding NarL/FixJ family response regulator